MEDNNTYISLKLLRNDAYETVPTILILIQFVILLKNSAYDFFSFYTWLRVENFNTSGVIAQSGYPRITLSSATDAHTYTPRLTYTYTYTHTPEDMWRYTLRLKED